jgi:beta-lactamase regulating signal transducer with metallopeptidase domain
VRSLSAKGEQRIGMGPPRPCDRFAGCLAFCGTEFDRAFFMWVWLDRFGFILFDAALSTAIFLSVVVLCLLVCRQPSRRLLIVRLSLLASLAMLPLALAPLPRLDVVAQIRDAGLLPPASLMELQTASLPSQDQSSHGDRRSSFISAFRGEYAAWAARWMPRSLTLIVVSVAATGAAWVVLGFWGVRWLVGHSRAPSPPTQAVYDAIAIPTTTRQPRPDLRVSSGVQRPVLVGFFRTTILIPSHYDEPFASAESLKLSLLHELAHAEQFDPWFGTIASLAQSVWFFLPHVWWLRSQLIMDQEFMADNAASLRYGTSSSYAASLLSLADFRPAQAAAGRRRRRHSITSSAGKSNVRSPLFQRMLMLLYCPFTVEQRPPWPWSWSLRLVLILACLASACICIRWPHAQAVEDLKSPGAFARHEAFQVSDFVTPPLVSTPEGRALPYHMPVALSSHFNLTVEILSSTRYLATVRIAGHPLVGDQSENRVADPLSDPASFAESWHQIRLMRHGHELLLWIDGRKSPVALDPGSTTERLTFEAGPDRPASFRNLVVQW